MKVKIKRLSSKSVIPSYAHSTDAGMDLTATSKTYDENGNVVYGTDLAFEIPKGYVGLLFPRSSNANKDLILSNSVGVIDSGYRGEVLFKFKLAMNSEKLSINIVSGISEVYYKNTDANYIDMKGYEIGDRIGQLIIMPYPTIEFEEVEELSTSDRNIGGYGSTGN